MLLCSRRRILCLTKLFLASWVLILIYIYFTLNAIPTPWQYYSLPHSIFTRLMSGEQHYHGNISIYLPLADLVVDEWNILSFYSLPRRQVGLLYTEITSANRDTSYPLAPDFTFHLQYGVNSVVLYEDYGPGCVHRVYLFPVLPTHADKIYKMSPEDLSEMYILFDLDGTEYQYSLKIFMEGSQWPFISPYNTQHKVLASGMGAYMPICYQKSMKISYISKDPLPGNLFDLTVNCSRNDLLCPVHIYSGISRTKFPSDRKVEAFASDNAVYKTRAEKVATLLKNADTKGSDGGSCQLRCIEMCKSCERVILQQDSPGVISAIKIRVFETATGILRSNWTDILFSASFDKADPPQVNKVPLGSLFGVTGSLNEFRGASFGKTKRHCSYGDHLLSLPNEAVTGYLYFPMPFWKLVKITLEGSEFIDTPLLVCHEVTTVPNMYDKSNTGYFHGHKSYYSDNVTGWRELLSLEGSWGQVVGVLMDVDNLRAVRDVSLNERWAALQADAVIYLDGSRSASVLGTGLEDYFSYAHGFAMAENTTYAFVGNFHAGPWKSEPLTWHCYRLHILDPIYFYHSIQFIMEGTSPQHFQQPQPSLTYKDFMHRKISGAGCLSHLVLYYAASTSGLTPTDAFHLTNDISEQEHQFEILKSSSRRTGDIFHLTNKRYLGASNKNETFSVSGRQFNPGDKMTFTLRCMEGNQGVILRREFHSLPKLSWNERARVWVDDEFINEWVIAMGTTSDVYSLRQEDFTIGATYTENKKEFSVTLEMLTVWRDISYKALSIT